MLQRTSRNELGKGLEENVPRNSLRKSQEEGEPGMLEERAGVSPSVTWVVPGEVLGSGPARPPGHVQGSGQSKKSLLAGFAQGSKKLYL